MPKMGSERDPVHTIRDLVQFIKTNITKAQQIVKRFLVTLDFDLQISQTIMDQFLDVLGLTACK